MSKQDFFHSLNRLPLLTKVCLISFGFTFLLAAMTISYQFWNTLAQHHAVLENCISDSVTPKLDYISEEVSKEHFSELRDFFAHFQPVCMSEQENPAQALAYSALEFQLTTQDGNILNFGQPIHTEHHILVNFPLSHWSQNTLQSTSVYWLGELDVAVDYSGYYASVLDESLSQLVKSFLVSLSGTVLGFLLGYKMIIKRIRQFIDQLNSDASYEQLKQFIDRDKTELSALWLSIVNFRERLDGKRLKTDIEYKRCKQELLDSQRESDLKSQFLAKMSHELRTPMNGLLGFSTLLLESKLEDEQKEYAQTIQASLESLLYVVNDVLDLSRIESGDLNITSIPFSLRSVVSGVTALLTNRAEAKGLEFETRIDPGVPDSLRGDPVRIRQVIMNLAANAIRHTEKGYVLINVMLLTPEEEFESDRTRIRIALEDSGLAVQKRLAQESADIEVGFSSEFRGKRSLGLDICSQLAELMDSELCQESRENGGSTYWLDLSLPVINQTIPTQVLDLSALNQVKVLVIDSYELSRKITIELLAQWGVAFEAVSTASEALKLIQNYPKNHKSGFNMVLCDDLLQDLSGIETCQRLRQVISPSVPIIVLCSNPQLGDAEGFFLSGANGFLSKQFRDPFLRSVMCQAFSERFIQGKEKRLITRYTISDAEFEGKQLPSYASQQVVLIVESNIINQQLLMNMLEKNDCRVDLASNGFEAIELFKSNKYDLLFMDCAMPDMDGFETTMILREIERSHPERQRTSIIAMTTNDIDGETERCFQVGMDELMTKPLKIAKLEMVLSRYIH